MSLTLPENSNQEVTQIQQDVKAELSTSNPWLAGGLIRAICVGLGKRIFDFYVKLGSAIKEAFPNTATDDRLAFWRYLKNMKITPADAASGEAVFVGTLASTVSIDEIVTVGGLEYKLLDTVTITSNAFDVSALSHNSLPQRSSRATCVTTSAHGLCTGMSVTISGVTNDTDWNDTYSNITVVDEKTITFSVLTIFTTPASGSIVLTHTSGAGTIECTKSGVDTNQEGGTLLELQRTVTGVDSTVYTQYAGLTGGQDEETEDENRIRVVERWRNPQTPFNPAAIKAEIKATDIGNTRVWVHRVTPQVGCVTAYFVRDNDDSIIPSAGEVAAALAAVVEIAPAERDTDDIHIEGCTGIEVDINFTALNPDTATMRQAIENAIYSFYRGECDEGEDHDDDKLSAAIWQAYDVYTGTRITSFTMTATPGNVTTADGYILIEGDITWST